MQGQRTIYFEPFRQRIGRSTNRTAPRGIERHRTIVRHRTAQRLCYYVHALLSIASSKE